MVKLEKVKKQYKDFELDCSMEIKEGWITGLVGQNGAGKSTAFKAMLGLIRSDSGKIEILGKTPELLGKEEREQIGVVMAGSGFNGYLSINDLIPIFDAMYQKFDKAWFLKVSMIMWYITAVIKTGNIAWDDWMSCCIGGVTAGLMMVAVALPAQLKFGPERGRIALVTIVLLAVALGILMQEFTKGTKFAQSAKRILNQIDKLGTKGILGVIVIIWVIVGVISMIISMRVMEKREF